MPSRAELALGAAATAVAALLVATILPRYSPRLRRWLYGESDEDMQARLCEEVLEAVAYNTYVLRESIEALKAEAVDLHAEAASLGELPVQAIAAQRRATALRAVSLETRLQLQCKALEDLLPELDQVRGDEAMRSRRKAAVLSIQDALRLGDGVLGEDVKPLVAALRHETP